MFGRERKIADIPTDHPSCSKQQAVIQYRKTVVRKERAIRPYLMDLDSTNGSYINNEKIEPQKYYELMEQDLIKFGNSRCERREFMTLWGWWLHTYIHLSVYVWVGLHSRDYVLLNSESV